MALFNSDYWTASLLFKVPKLSKEMVPLDSRIMTFEESKDIKAPYVLRVSDYSERGKMITVPLNETSRRSKQRLRQYKNANSVSYSILDNGTLKVQRAITRKNRTPDITDYEGVDTGMKDCFHTSSRGAFGTMEDVIKFYKEVVEPSFGELTSLRNKKRKISHYLRKHKDTLPKSVKDDLIDKMNRLEQMIEMAEAPYRKKRHYYQQLEHEIRTDVNQYISSIDRNTLTVIELLDIKEFNKSRKLNGELSVFARGKLQKTLMDTLSWRGFSYKEVPADYTSQICPECHYLHKANRSTEDSKKFKCLCCGYQDDADHVGALNIRERAMDEEFQDIWNSFRYQHKKFQQAVISYYDKKNMAYKETHESKDAVLLL